MNKKDFNGIFDKAFGKERDEKVHAVAMLIIYFIFISAVVIFVRMNSDNKENTNNVPDNGGNVVTPTPTPEATPKPKKVVGDVNYRYSYTITFDGEVETYIGKIIDDKQKFSYTKDGVTLEYAIKDGNYLIDNDGIYRLTDALDTYFKYCDADKIISLIEDKATDGEYYNVTTAEIASIFEEEIVLNKDSYNNIILDLDGDTLKSIYIDLSNYISAKLGTTHTLGIKMEFADIGKVEDFTIKTN